MNFALHNDRHVFAYDINGAFDHMALRRVVVGVMPWFALVVGCCHRQVQHLQAVAPALPG